MSGDFIEKLRDVSFLLSTRPNDNYISEIEFQVNKFISLYEFFTSIQFKQIHEFGFYFETVSEYFYPAISDSLSNRLALVGVVLVGDLAILNEKEIRSIDGIGSGRFAELKFIFGTKKFDIGQNITWWPRPKSIKLTNRIKSFCNP